MVNAKKPRYPYENEALIYENPEKYYNFDDTPLGTGKFSIVKKCTSKKTGEVFAAKIIKYDDVTILFAKREFEIMKDRLDKLGLKAVPKLHEAYLVRKYMILIMTLCEGKSVLEYFGSRASYTEEDVAGFIKQLCETLKVLHDNNIVHLDVRPTNIRVMASASRDVRLLDYNSANHLPNKKAGTVVDVIGDTEFCAPEMLSFDRVRSPSDIWSVGVITFILLSGTSPFFDEDEMNVSTNVQKAKFVFEDEWSTISSEAKAFVKDCFKQNPDMRMDASKCLAHTWLSDEYAANRKKSSITDNARRILTETDARLLSEEEEEYVEQSGVFRTFEEEEYESPESSDDEDED